MKISPIALAVALLFAVAVGFFIGRGTTAEPQLAQATEQKEAPAVAEQEESTTSSTTPDGGEAAPSDSEETVAANTDNTATPPDAPTTSDAPEVASPTRSGPVAPLAGNILPPVKMGISDAKMTQVLSSIAANMEAEKLAYISSKLQDCSGIFHRIKDRLQSRLPALKAGGKYVYPDVKQWRSSRQIADWYHEQGNLLIVKDPMASKNSIRPGSVMFFGQSGKIFRDLTIEKLTDRDNNYTKNGAIQHIAVVTEVFTDAEGNVIAYDMMHARYPGGPPASRSGSKAVQSTSAKNKAKVAPYPFGHWTQQWVAVANIATPAGQAGAVASTGK